MINVRHIIRAATCLLVLAVSVASGTAAYGQRVTPNSGGPGSVSNQADLSQGTPIWVYLVVAASAILLTLAVERLVTHLRRGTPPGRPSHA